jgi:transcriptional regulator with XRE-family HTH domain
MRIIIDEKKIGETVRRLRIRKGIPLEDVAAKANLSPISVRSLELGRGSTISTMLKVLKAIDETGFILDWSEKSREISPMQALRESRRLASEARRVSKKQAKGRKVQP